MSDYLESERARRAWRLRVYLEYPPEAPQLRLHRWLLKESLAFERRTDEHLRQRALGPSDEADGRRRGGPEEEPQTGREETGRRLP